MDSPVRELIDVIDALELEFVQCPKEMFGLFVVLVIEGKKIGKCKLATCHAPNQFSPLLLQTFSDKAASTVSASFQADAPQPWRAYVTLKASARTAEDFLNFAKRMSTDGEVDKQYISCSSIEHSASFAISMFAGVNLAALALVAEKGNWTAS